jgi:Phage gp6-like head-tail connector protein
MSIMNLVDIKDHIRVTITDDDDLIQSKIDAAETWIGLYLGAALTTFIPSGAEGDTETGLPEPLQEAVRQLVGFLYDNREAAVVGNTITVTQLTPGMYDLLAPYRCYVF